MVVNLVKRRSAVEAKNQLRFLVKKPAPLLLKLLNSALANAKHNFNLKEENLFLKSLIVEGGPILKRWLPRAMGRATPLAKRTCSVKLVLEEITPTGGSRASVSLPPKGEIKKIKKSEVKKIESVSPVAPEQKIEKAEMKEEQKIKSEAKEKKPVLAKPYGASGQAKKRIFTRQTFGNIKKFFRRKSI